MGGLRGSERVMMNAFRLMGEAGGDPRFPPCHCPAQQVSRLVS
jgi:hypothetical protein